jgi:hypothetical protein
LRALLDEQLPVELADAIKAAGPHHQISSVVQEGWRGVKNGELLRRAREAMFGVLITADRRMEHQQNIPRAGLGVIVLHAPRIRIQELAPMAPEIASALDTVQPGQIIHLDAGSWN